MKKSLWLSPSPCLLAGSASPRQRPLRRIARPLSVRSRQRLRDGAVAFANKEKENHRRSIQTSGAEMSIACCSRRKGRLTDIVRVRAPARWPKLYALVTLFFVTVSQTANC